MATISQDLKNVSPVCPSCFPEDIETNCNVLKMLWQWIYCFMQKKIALPRVCVAWTNIQGTTYLAIPVDKKIPANYKCQVDLFINGVLIGVNGEFSEAETWAWDYDPINHRIQIISTIAGQDPIPVGTPEKPCRAKLHIYPCDVVENIVNCTMNVPKPC